MVGKDLIPMVNKELKELILMVRKELIPIYLEPSAAAAQC